MSEHRLNESDITKSALVTFASLALVVYAIAFTYCYMTEHFLGVGLLGIAGFGVGCFAAYTYKQL